MTITTIDERLFVCPYCTHEQTIEIFDADDTRASSIECDCGALFMWSRRKKQLFDAHTEQPVSEDSMIPLSIIIGDFQL